MYMQGVWKLAWGTEDDSDEHYRSELGKPLPDSHELVEQLPDETKK